jgi:ABC-2 type transport system ATP-binding protein
MTIDANKSNFSQHLVSVDNAVKHFGRLKALGGVSLNLNEGECLGLIGRNGAGKTTLMRAICGRLSLDEGTVSLKYATSGSVGLVPQEVALYPTLTARENLQYFSDISGLPRQQRAEVVDGALKWVGLTERGNDIVKQLSFGMQKRLNVAVGILHSPKVILLDEPSAGVDPQSRAQIWALIDRLKQDRKTILIISQHLEEVERVCDRIVIMDKGSILAQGDLDTLTEDTIGCYWTVNVDIRDESGTHEVQHINRKIGDIGVDLPLLIEEIDRNGNVISGIRIAPPSLEAVFFALVGEDLDVE